MSYPEPFEIYLDRYNKLYDETIKSIPEMKEDSTDEIELSRENTRLLYNLIYAALGIGTLFLRIGTIAQIAWYMQNLFETDPDPSLNRMIINLMRDKQISDGDWKALWGKMAVISLGSGHDFIKGLAGVKNDETERFVSIRNKIVHRREGFSFSEWKGFIRDLALFVKHSDNFIGIDIALDEESRIVLTPEKDDPIILSPLMRSGDNGGHYIFQGIIGKGEGFKFLNGHTGKVNEKLTVEDLHEFFQKIKKKAAGDILIHDFIDVVEDYCELFVGRDKEVDIVKDFLESGKSVLRVTAEVGFGKSALLANCVNIMRSDKELKGKLNCRVHFCSSGLANKPSVILENLLKQNPNIFHNPFPEKLKIKSDTPLPYDFDQLVHRFHEQLEVYNSIQLERKDKGKDKAIVILIDGLEESLLGYKDTRIDSLFRVKEKDEDENETIRDWEIPEYVKIIVGYRKGSNVYVPDGCESLTLGPLDESSLGLAFGNDLKDSRVREKVLLKGKPLGGEEGTIDPAFLRLFYNMVQEGRASLDSPASVPDGLSGMYMDELKKLGFEEYERAVKVLGFCTVAAGPVSEGFLGELVEFSPPNGVEGDDDVDEDLFGVKDIVDCFPKWFTQDQDGRLGLYHERLRGFLLSLLSGSEQGEMHVRFCEMTPRPPLGNGVKVEEGVSAEIYRYLLKYLHYHLIMGERDDEAFELVMDEGFRKGQVGEFLLYDATFEALEYVLRNELRRTQLVWGSGEFGEEEKSGQLSRYCQVTLQCGETGDEAVQGINIAFEWAKEGRIKDAINRLYVIKNEDRFLKSLFFLLWITVDEDGFNIEEKNKNIEVILNLIDENQLEVIETSKWNIDYIIADVMLKLLINKFNIEKFLRKTNQLVNLINVMCKIIIEKYKNIEINILDNILEIIKDFDEEKDKSNALIDVASVFAKNEQFEELLDFLNSIEINKYNDEAITNIAINISKIGEIEYAYRIKEKLSVVNNIKILQSIAFYHQSKGVNDKVLSILEELLEVVNEIKDSLYKAEVLIFIAKYLIFINNRNKAKLILEKALNGLQLIDFSRNIEIDFDFNEGLTSSFKISEIIRTISELLNDIEEIDTAKIILDEMRSVLDEIKILNTITKKSLTIISAYFIPLTDDIEPIKAVSNKLKNEQLLNIPAIIIPPRSITHYHSFSFPKIPEKEIRKILPREIQKLTDHSPENIIFDFNTGATDTDVNENKTNIITYYFEKNIIWDMLENLKANGITAIKIIPEVQIIESFIQNNFLTKEKSETNGIVVIDMISNKINMNIFNKNFWSLNREFPFKGSGTTEISDKDFSRISTEFSRTFQFFQTKKQKHKYR